MLLQKELTFSFVTPYLIQADSTLTVTLKGCNYLIPIKLVIRSFYGQLNIYNSWHSENHLFFLSLETCGFNKFCCIKSWLSWKDLYDKRRETFFLLMSSNLPCPKGNYTTLIFKIQNINGH